MGGDQQLRVVLHFDGRLDAERLRQALSLSTRALPVLGCRWEDAVGAPSWRPFALPPARDLLTLESEHDAFGGPRAAALRPLALRAGLPWRAHLLRGAHDTLCMRWHHAVGDGAGVMEHLHTVADLYNRLGADPGLRPEPRLGSRGLWPVLRAAGPKSWLRLLGGDLFGGAPRQRHLSLDLKPAPNPRPVAVVRRLSAETLGRQRALRATQGASLNDLLLAAFFRSLELQHPAPQGLPRHALVTVNLRRYLSPAMALAVCEPANRSHHLLCSLPPALPGSSLAALLGQCQRATARAKRSLPGLRGLLPLLALLRLLPWPGPLRMIRRLADPNRDVPPPPPCLSNAGRLVAARLDFGGLQPVDAVAAGPVGRPPTLQVGLTSYRGAVTLCVLTCGGHENRARVRGLLDGMVSVLHDS